MARLIASVMAAHPDGGIVEFSPGDEVPAWAARLLDNPAAWEGGELPTLDDAGATPADAGSDPAGEAANPEGDTADRPRGNASLADWTAYAKAQGVTDDELDGMSRADIRARFEQ